MVTGFSDGNNLYNMCQAPMGELGFSNCMEYVAGVSDAIQAYEAAGIHTVCLVNQITKGQEHDVVLNWLKAHPQNRHLQAANLVYAALSEAFPCAKP